MTHPNRVYYTIDGGVLGCFVGYLGFDRIESIAETEIWFRRDDETRPIAIKLKNILRIELANEGKVSA